MAEKDTRTYIRVHDGLPDHPKIIAAGGEAGWLYICGLSYCSRQLTDGVIPKGLVPRLTDSSNSEALASALLRVGLWHGFDHDCPRCPPAPADSYVVHDYVVHQRSHSEVKALSEKRAAAGRKGGRRSGEVRRAASAAEANGEASASAKPKQPRSKTEADTEAEAEVVKRTTRTPSESSEPLRHDVERVCRHLAAAIEKGGDPRPQITKKWRTDMRRLIDVDGITPDQAIAAIDWAHASDFWNAHILSPAKLRDKFTTLRRQAANEQRRHHPSGPQTANRDMTDEEIRNASTFG
ncbi:hypothetical protein ACFFSH_40095 [Streptomyces filamentosus]|uniref:Uncharacterized protein n=1 Tax=Streptomyces filamentosus TaxID=67294 RepID=A0A919B9G1_STRFL|nr:hypothetical protein [Streptomyces filamentosus]GHF76874.1 hypothetical protein GCM10017667_00010 [Streptomyces filamentosus]